MRTSWSFLLQTEQATIPYSFFTGKVLQSSDNLHGSPLGPLQQLHISSVLEAPDLDAVLQMSPHEDGTEEDNHLPLPAGHPYFDTAQDTVGFPGYKNTLLVCVELFIHQHLQVLFLKAALSGHTDM